MTERSANTRRQHSRQPSQWWAKTSVGLLGGLLLAYGVVTLFAWYGPGGLHDGAKVQFNMWMVTPIWLTVFSLSYLFDRAQTAAKVLGAANSMCWGLFIALRVMG